MRHHKSPEHFLMRGLFATAIVFIPVLTVIIIGLGNAKVSVDGQGQRLAEDAVRRAAVSCYAFEGSYPESYKYLKEHYNLKINEEIYTVDYNIFASNVMPDITVLKR